MKEERERVHIHKITRRTTLSIIRFSCPYHEENAILQRRGVGEGYFNKYACFALTPPWRRLSALEVLEDDLNVWTRMPMCRNHADSHDQTKGPWHISYKGQLLCTRQRTTRRLVYHTYLFSRSIPNLALHPSLHLTMSYSDSDTE